jgi:2-dehydro-3-deoxyphosphogluconate aldolase/(4S)-4-hydroxy-2-oxoglutarate aldolase
MSKVPGGVVGAGTLLNAEDVAAAKSAGAKFGVSPGVTNELLDAVDAQNMPLLPGAATASEAMALLARGYTVQKFFPAEANGGASALRAIGAPIPQVKFCPTGGVSLQNGLDYLSLDNTLCVGGSWVAPKQMISERNWDGIEALAREASALPR